MGSSWHSTPKNPCKLLRGPVWQRQCGFLTLNLSSPGTLFMTIPAYQVVLSPRPGSVPSGWPWSLPLGWIPQEADLGNHLPNKSQGQLLGNHLKTKTARTSSLKPAQQPASSSQPSSRGARPPPPGSGASSSHASSRGRQHAPCPVLRLSLLLGVLHLMLGANDSFIHPSAKSLGHQPVFQQPNLVPEAVTDSSQLAPEPTRPGPVRSQGETRHIRRSESSFKISKNKI
uniref:uncharacterized protein LOC118522634 isoform X1 n=1 Tax=Halichoerus grypus TaxID=9711 RepID=UPI001659C33C|nr:uncharacterized protein LOC118522634 isoform X1 [Halichoerus grypus]